MPPSLYDFQDYKTYLGQGRPRGFRRDLARATGCQTAYISHVLNGSGHLNPEQAEAAARFLQLGKHETLYFLTLVNHARAGTPSLKKLLADQLRDLREEHLQLSRRVGIAKTLSRESQAIYYSSWHYAAVHMAVTLPTLKTRGALQRALRISPEKLDGVLEFLVSSGLLESASDGGFSTGQTLLHLEKSSPFIAQHHANWREKAVTHLRDMPADESLHYSSVLTLSRKDVEKLRSLLTENLGEWISVVKNSAEEEIYALGLDFFPLS